MTVQESVKVIVKWSIFYRLHQKTLYKKNVVLLLSYPEPGDPTIASDSPLEIVNEISRSVTLDASLI